MSRSVIRGLAEGQFDPRSSACRDFLMVLCQLVSGYKDEWGRINGGAGKWQQEAVKSILSIMATAGPDGGKPAIQAVYSRMSEFERKDGAERSDKDWRSYFIVAFLNEQRRYLDRELGIGLNSELRRRLLDAFVECGIVSSDKEHYGPAGAEVSRLEVKKIVGALGTRSASGVSAIHRGAVPTVGELEVLIHDFGDAFPQVAMAFPLWELVTMAVFNVHHDNVIPWDETEENEDGEGYGGPSNLTSTATDGEEALIRRIDGRAARIFLINTLVRLDQGIQFPKGKHAKVFVEYLLWSENEGLIGLRCTQQEYAKRVGVVSTTIKNAKDAIFAAISRDWNSEDDYKALKEAFLILQKEFLEQHLEVFNSPPLDENHETTDDAQPS
jgi:hypothetical protein